RPPLSKKFLAERPPPDSLFFRPAAFWQSQGVALELGMAVAEIAPLDKRVTLAGGHELAYDALVIATGTRARALPLPGAGLAGVFSLRKIDDVLTLRGPLDDARRVVIVGGGYIGLETAAVIRSEGRDVTV